MNYKTKINKLAGIQLIFDDNTYETNMIQTSNVVDSEATTIQLNLNREVRQISVRILNSVNFEAVRFHDSAGNIIKEVVWSTSPNGTWTGAQTIPNNKAIIGVKASVQTEPDLV